MTETTFQWRKLTRRELTRCNNPPGGRAWFLLGPLEGSWWVGVVC